MAYKRKNNIEITIKILKMKKSNYLQGGADYVSPWIDLIEVEAAQVLCTSDTDQITGNTGASWETGEDAEW